ncbi:MAG: class II fructose-bisphosphate aldolase [Balneola sp.]
MLKKTIRDLREKRKSMIAFNVQNLAQLKILFDTATSSGHPVIAQFSSRYINYLDEMIGLDRLVEKYQNNGVFFHLDHCLDLKIIKKSIETGFSGVMFDGSSYSIDENISITNHIFETIKKEQSDTILEVELGSIMGIEDGIEGSENADYFAMDDLAKMVELGNFDLMALAIGNAHGEYESTSQVKPELLNDATQKFPDLDLVLHGGTGLPELLIKECIDFGVVKINVSTDLKKITQDIYRSYTANEKYYNENKCYDYLSKHLGPFYNKYIEAYTN